jgi:hypothetical protein
LQAEAYFFAALVAPLDARARKRLIETEELLFTDPVLAHHDPGFCRAQAHHKKAVKVIEQERLLAGEIALALIRNEMVKEAGRDGIEARADGEPIGPFTIENACAWAMQQQQKLRGQRFDPDKVNPQYFRKHGWKNSKPVLHLAAAVQGMTRSATPAMKPLGAAALSQAFADPDLTKNLFEAAERYRGVLLGIAKTGAFQLEDRETVRLIADDFAQLRELGYEPSQRQHTR